MTAIDTPLVTEARNASLEDMVAILRDQQARKIDMVVPAERLRFEGASLRLSDLDLILEADGFTDPNGLYLPTRVFDEKLSDYLKMPLAYVRRLRAERPDLYDANANGWLLGRKGKLARPLANSDDVPEWKVEPLPGDARSFLLRLFRGEDGEHGVGRAILSNRFKMLENLDGLMALLAGIKAAGLDPSTLSIDRCDLTERRMYVKVSAPEIQALAPELLKGYRNPFANGAERAERMVRGRDVDEWRQVAAGEGMAYTEEEGGEPIVFAGFVFSNSEVGGGRWTVTPEITVQICKNGLTFTEEAFGKVHVGAAMDDGLISWSEEVQDKSLELVTLQTRDVVTNFLDVRYVQAKVAELEEKSGAKIKAADVEVLAKRLSFSEEETNGILEHFMLGGQISAGGFMQAISSYSQTVYDADRAHELDGKAVAALEMAYAHAQA